MGNSDRVAREKVLPWNGEVVVDFYIKAHPSFLYREQLLEMLLEAHRAYLAGCPRASIIMAGEALLRVVYDRLAELTIKQGKTEAKVRGKVIAFEDTESLFKMADSLTFCDALKMLKRYSVYPEELIDQMFAVKDLRNSAAHSNLPLLDYWDPDDPRSEADLKKLLRGEMEIPEGYRFLQREGRWFKFDCRRYRCGSLRYLSPADRLAVIQYLLVEDAISKL